MEKKKEGGEGEEEEGNNPVIGRLSTVYKNGLFVS